MNPYLSTSKRPLPLPAPEILRREIDESIEWVKTHVGEDNKAIGTVQTFVRTSPVSIENFQGDDYPQRESPIRPGDTGNAQLTDFDTSTVVHKSANDRVLRHARHGE